MPLGKIPGELCSQAEEAGQEVEGTRHLADNSIEGASLMLGPRK